MIAIENREIVARFDGYGPYCQRHDKRIQLNEMTSEEIRAPTNNDSLFIHGVHKWSRKKKKKG